MSVTIREARREDLASVVNLPQQLSLDDPRERPDDLEAYEAALSEVLSDERQKLLVAELEGHVVGTAAVIHVPNLSHVGRPYTIVENVEVNAASRGHRVGEALMQRAIELAKARGCYKVSLSSNRQRADAHRFYERLGFIPSHFGFRMDL